MINTKLKIFILLAFFIIVPNRLGAQNTEFDSLVNVGITQVYNIKFDQAEETFKLLEQRYPKHPAGKFFDAMIVWWRIMLDQNNEDYDEIFEDKLEDVIDFCDDILDEDEQNVDAIFFKGGALGFRGRLYSIRKDWFDAALDGKDALPLVYEAFSIDSTNEDVKLGFGIYNYYAEAIPEKYPFIKPAMIFFPKGDKEKGIMQLQNAADSAKYAAIESEFFLMNLYYQFENDYDKALKYASNLHNKFPDNPIFQKYVGRSYIKKGNYSEASKYFADIRKKCLSDYPGYNKLLHRESEYYLAVNYLKIDSIDSAQASFGKCIELSNILDEDEESGFKVNATLYQAKILKKLGEKEKALNLYYNILDMRNFSNSHKKAEKYINELVNNK